MDIKLKNHEQVINRPQEDNDRLNNEVKDHQLTIREKKVSAISNYRSIIGGGKSSCYNF